MLRGSLVQLVAAAKALVSFQHTSVEVLNDIGSKLLQTFYKELALRMFIKALQKKPNEKRILLNVALAKRSIGEIEEALEILKKIISGHPKYVNGLNTLSIMLQNEGKIQEAKDLNKKILKLQPNNVSNLYNYSLLINEVNRT